MDYQTQIDNLIELAIVQRDELKQLVEQLPQLREYLSAEVEKKIEAIEPELRQELEEFFARKTEERVDVLRGDVSERVAEMLKSLEMAAAAKYSALMNERARNAELLSQAEQKIADAAATIPSKVKDIVLDELSRFPRANQIDQLRKEFAEPKSLNPRGKWQPNERYNKLDLVSYNGESYVSNIDDNTTKPARNSSTWTLSAARGIGGGGPSDLNALTQPPSDGTLLIGSGTSWVNGNIIGGTGVTVTNQPGSILIDATGAQEILTATVKNAEATTITKGQVVYLFSATGNMASVKLAYNTSDATSAKTFGVVSSTSITPGGTGTVTCVGVLDGLNLGGYTDGDTVYLGATPGSITATKPYAPNHLVYVGIIERANAGNGELYVRIQNGYELDEIHDVQINAPKLAGQTLLYDATTDLWKNARLTGTANQITVTNADAAVTLSIPTNPTLNGTATMGSINASGNIQIGGAPLIVPASIDRYLSVNVTSLADNPALALSVFDGTKNARGSMYIDASTTQERMAWDFTYSSAQFPALEWRIAGNIHATLRNNGSLILNGTGTDSNNGRLQLATHTTSAGGIGFGTDISLSRSAGDALDFTVSTGAPTFRFMNGAVYRGYVGTNGATTVLNSQSGDIQLQTSNAIALLLSANQNATFYKDVFLGSNGPSIPSSLLSRGARQMLALNGTAGTTVVQPAFGTGDFALAFIVRLNSLPSGAAVLCGNSLGGAIPQTYILPTGVIRVDGSATINSNTALVTNKTYTIVVTRSGTSTSIYVDGLLDISASDTKNYSSGIDYIGRNAAGNYVDGSLYPLAYNRALSAAEVKALYERGVPAATDICAAGSQLLTGNNSTFATGQGNWQSINGGTVSASSGVFNVTTSGNYIGGGTENGIVQKGRRYRFTFTLASYTGALTSVMVFTNDGTSIGAYAAGTHTVDFTAVVTSYLGFSTANGLTGTFTIDNVTLVPFGAVLAPDAAQTGSGLTWYDTSGNGANITLPASGVAWNVPFNGRIQFADGTTAAPSLTFSSAPTTGFFRLSSTQIGCTFSGALAGYIWAPTANNIRFAGNSQGYFEVAGAGGLNAVAAGANQNITLIPSGSGDVRIVGSAFSTLRFYDGATQKGALFFSTADGALEYNDAANTSVKLYTGAPADSLVLSSSGFLLLGVSNPGNANGRLQLANHTTLTGGIGLGSGTAIYNDGTAGVVRVQKVGGGGFGALHLYSDTQLRASLSYNATDGYVDAPVGSLIFRTSGTVTALTINSSQNSVFAGNVAVQGSVASDGVNGNALFGGAKRVIIGYDTTADIGNIAAVHTGTAWKALALQPVSGAVLIGKTSDTGNGRLQFAESTSAQNGIQFGTDTNLYRSAANTLKTDDNFNIGGTVSATSSASNYEWNISSSGVGGPFITLDATNATAGSRFTGLLLKNNGTLEWTAQLRFGDSKFHVYDAVRNVSTLTIAQGALSGVAGLSTFAGKVTITDSTASTAYNTGCLTLSGGFGVQGNSYFGGTVNVGTTLVIGTIGLGTFSPGAIYKNSSLGLVVGTIAGSSYDLFLTNPSGNYIMQVPTGTRNVEFAATLTTIGTITSGAAISTSAPVGGSGAWELGVYTATAPTATGYVTIEIGGVQYKLLAAT